MKRKKGTIKRDTLTIRVQARGAWELAAARQQKTLSRFVRDAVDYQVGLGELGAALSSQNDDLRQPRKEPE